MAITKIAGELLESNLIRTTDLAFNTNVLVVDAQNGRIGIGTDTPGNFKLDGGAMFGVVPKTIWQRTNPADSNNLIDMSMRCMLIEDGERLILIDTGLGDKQSEKFFGYYFLFGDFTLASSLKTLFSKLW